MSEIRTLPVLPLRDIVVFPHMVVPLFVGRDKSVKALEEVMRTDKQILLVTQKNAAQDDPSPADIYAVGTVGTVLQLLKLPDGTVKVLVEGGMRAKIQEFAETEPFFVAKASALPEAEVQSALSERLAGFKRPKRVLFVEDLPRNAMGKVQKALLRERYAKLYA